MERLKFVGLDVHSETIAVAVAEQDGEVRALGISAITLVPVQAAVCIIRHSWVRFGFTETWRPQVQTPAPKKPYYSGVLNRGWLRLSPFAGNPRKTFRGYLRLPDSRRPQ